MASRNTPLLLPDPLVLDGVTIRFAPLTSASKPFLQEAVGKLSDETSRRRFFTVRHQLSEQELVALTTLDGWDRVAIGACASYPDGRDEAVGVARFVRLPERPTQAESAVVVVDEWQRRGIGKLLLRSITDAAMARGIKTLHCFVLSDNDPMIGFLSQHAGRLSRVEADDHIDFSLHLDSSDVAAAT
ncbi:MAG TPA: GNAT family N-acetyltransferase [Casimicrobiaceae bacterium]|nr:GNAT family N-acetyltransferase [Casimicrobiaceae bacterium]